jgi:putative transposase
MAIDERCQRELGKNCPSFQSKGIKMIHDAGFATFQWQRNYYDHIIRNDTDLMRIRTYIANNPLQWALDEENLRHEARTR